MPKKDINQLAHSIVAIATGEAKPLKAKKNANHGQQLGGLKGGKARADKLTPQKRKEIAEKAAKFRWTKKK